MNELIEIHEFSTGIEIIGTPGNWKVGGFTGNYSNSTIASVPTPVQNAISSEYFAVAENTTSDNPAVIGREVIGASGEWSVVAVVTKGIDNMGRTASLYRYFLCEGAGNIHYILQWMNQEKGGILVFDPFDEQTVGHPHRYRYEITSSNSINVRPELEALLDGSPTVIVPSAEPCAPTILNAMANRLGHPVSWAYHVKGIANPISFQIIQPVDSQSEQIIRSAIARTPKRPQLHGQEQPITTAIKGLTNREQFKPEHLQTIEKALANPRIKNKDWQDFFENLGAKAAIKDKIYTLSIIRLLTLQAMVLPENLPVFLSWIQQSNNKKYYSISYKLQNQIYKYSLNSKINLLKDKSREGVITIIPQLFKQHDLIAPLVWLLKDSKGIWGYLYQTEIKPKIDQDFKLIAKGYRTKQNEVKLEVLSHSSWKKILNNIQIFWQANADKYIQEDYQPIAKFFLKIQKISKSYLELQLYALFLYISQRKIPKKLFLNLDKNRKSSDEIYVYVYDVPLEREVPWSETLYLGAKSNIQKLYVVTLNIIKILWKFKIPSPLVILLLMLTDFGAGIYYKNLLVKNPEPPPEKETPIEKKTPRVISKAELSIAFNQFGTTQKAIKKEIYQPVFATFKDVINDHEKLKTEIKNAIKKTLDPENKLDLQYDAIEKEDLDIDNSPNQKYWVENWIKAIYSYQQKKQQEELTINVVGYLLPDDLTNEPLGNDTRNNIDSKFKSEDSSPPGGEEHDKPDDPPVDGQ